MERDRAVSSGFVNIFGASLRLQALAYVFYLRTVRMVLANCYVSEASAVPEIGKPAYRGINIVLRCKDHSLCSGVFFEDFVSLLHAAVLSLIFKEICCQRAMKAAFKCNRQRCSL